MKNLKHFESYGKGENGAELQILHWGKNRGAMSNTYRLLVKLTSPSGEVFHVDGTQIRETDVDKLVREFGATIEERY